jgi:hypothetical protein
MICQRILAEPYNRYVLRTRPKRAPIVARRSPVLRRVILDAASSLVAVAVARSFSRPSISVSFDLASFVRKLL